VATVDEASAIVVGVRAGTPVILLVTAKRSPEQWIFPKGHVEVGETLEAVETSGFCVGQSRSPGVRDTGFERRD
jgi:8-oxo-dGTP pyrophosphatase MutT (NUDIX family)